MPGDINDNAGRSKISRDAKIKLASLIMALLAIPLVLIGLFIAVAVFL